MEEHKVYHIRECGKEDVSQGYIGVTSNLPARTRSHKHSGMLNTAREVVVLFTGTKSECYQLEADLRPEEGIGWNKGIGGYRKAGNILKGQHLSKSTEFKSGMTPHNKGSGKDYILTSPDGEVYLVVCLTDFCRTHNLTPANIRKVAKGERNFHKGWKATVLAGR